MSCKRRLLSLATLYPNAHAPRFGTFVARSLEALARRGDWDVTVINPIGLPPFAPGRYAPLARAAVDGVEHGVSVLRPRFTLIPKLGGPFNPWTIARTVLPVARRLHHEAPFDLVDAQFFYPDGPAAARIARELGLPLSIKARGADISHWGQLDYSRRMMVAAGEQAAGLLSVSEALARDMAAIGLPPEKITVHYTGLDRARFRPHPKRAARAEIAAQLKLDLPKDARLLSSVGALIPRKGQEYVLHALTALLAAHLLLIGKGEDEVRLARLAQDLGLAARVHFTGSLDHDLLPLALSASDAMVLPSLSEGLANAWVEALACGTPLVITDAGGARELLRDPVAGRIVARNPDAIVLALRELLANPPPPEDVARTVAHFGWDSHADALARYYAGLLE